ncbi:glycosyltransferase [Pedococcus sp. NPDC057267]|uniref:glycosyltransferase n=1 Tax=Pedococcus sp. NPDC057267 TaxID=3346077 RepID=UPI003644BE82
MIGYYAHHQGAGHVTRMQAVAAALDEPVWGLSSAPRPSGWSSGWTELARDDDTAGDPLDGDADVTAQGALHWAPRGHAGLARRAQQVVSWAARHRPRLLVVDVSVEVALLARLAGVPTVVVALPGRREDRAHRLAYDTAEALLAPWPAGTHERSWPPEWVAKTRCVGGISRFDARLRPAAAAPSGARPTIPRTGSPALVGPSGTASGGGTPGPTVLLLWGAGGRGTTSAQVAAARAATPGWTWLERSPGAHASTGLWDELLRADVVVTHAGQNAVAEVAAARRPAVVVAQPRPHDEQVATAECVEELGLAVGRTSWPHPHEWPELLERALTTGGAGWSRWSGGDGAARAATLLSQVGLSARVPA